VGVVPIAFQTDVMGENQNFGDGGDGELMNMYIDEL
jgi:hypothetical protein